MVKSRLRKENINSTIQFKGLFKEFKEFKDDLIAKNRSPYTIKSYRGSDRVATVYCKVDV